MSNSRQQYEVRLLESALREKLGGHKPPDLSEQIAAATSASPPQPVDAAARRWMRIRLASLVAVSASLLVAVAGATSVLSGWRFGIGSGDNDGPIAQGQSLPTYYGATDDVQYFAPGPESKLQRSVAASEDSRLHAQNNLKQVQVALKSEREAQEDTLAQRETAYQVLVDASKFSDITSAYATVKPPYEGERSQFNAERSDDSQSLQMLVTPRIVVENEVEALLANVEPSDQTITFPSPELWDQLATRGDKLKSIEDLVRAAESDPEKGVLLRRELEQLQEQLRQDEGRGPGEGGDKYDRIVENQFLRTLDNPLSTFSIDVDTASYSKTRMYLLEHRMLPPPDAVRIEELVNYFDYDYDGPADEHPFAAHLEAAECPWNTKHRLVRIALKGREMEEKRPASNLVFLLDVSGSMDEPNKLPLVQKGMSMLVRQLGENDRVAIVVYAGAAGLVLPSTPGSDQPAILESINRLHAGGSTNGGEGIRLAYQTALDHLIAGGVNRVILCTDGDFNVGVTSTGEITRLAEEHAKAGVYLSVLGFGMGNHNDAMLEEISNKANGNYAFIDTESEARKVLVEQMNGTLVTIAKDVKIQVEFNPAQVAAYRLLGYENRILAAEDFNDDKKDAGEIGAGHTVTALYEIVPAEKGKRDEQPAETDKAATPPAVDDLKYQSTRKLTKEAKSSELLTLKLRYKQPDADTSTLMSMPLAKSDARFAAASRDFQFAASVAAFGMILRGSQFKGDATLDAVEEIAESAKGDDRFGYRGEFLGLVKAAKTLGAQ
jgi:Ca-activated chloride channel family protein